MLNEFLKYKYFRKSPSEFASDEIVNNLSRKLWNDSGYNIAYHLGIVNYLTAMVKTMQDTNNYSKKDLIMFIASIRTFDDTPDEIKSLVDIVLEELKDKESK